MPSYLVDVYGDTLRLEELPQAGRRARLAAAELTRQGIRVRFVGSISVPEDEMCFYLFEGPSARAVGEASRRAAIEFERVIEAVPVAACEGSDEDDTSALAALLNEHIRGNP